MAVDFFAGDDHVFDRDDAEPGLEHFGSHGKIFAFDAEVARVDVSTEIFRVKALQQMSHGCAVQADVFVAVGVVADFDIVLAGERPPGEDGSAGAGQFSGIVHRVRIEWEVAEFEQSHVGGVHGGEQGFCAWLVRAQKRAFAGDHADIKAVVPENLNSGKEFFRVFGIDRVAFADAEVKAVQLPLPADLGQFFDGALWHQLGEHEKFHGDTPVCYGLRDGI